MKEFNLELSKQGHPVCTRDGRPARVICWDCKNHMGEDDTPIVALVQLSDGGEYPYCYYENGLFTDRHTDKRDLMMASVKHEGWVNVFNDGKDNYTGNKIYATKKEAEEYGGRFRIATAKIEWE
jgi:hypothetical protein